MSKEIKNKLSVRKEAAQERSKFTLSSIVEAAVHILKSRPIKDFTTRKVAEKAGVSVGSYYQYFPNKESLMAKVIEKEVNKNLKELEKIIEANHDSPISKVIRDMIEYIYGRLFESPSLSRIILKEIYKLDQVEVIVQSRHSFYGLIEKFIRLRELKVEKENVRIFILVNSIMGCLENAILDKDIQFEKDEFIDDLVFLAINHLNIEEEKY